MPIFARCLKYEWHAFGHSHQWQSPDHVPQPGLQPAQKIKSGKNHGFCIVSVDYLHPFQLLNHTIHLTFKSVWRNINESFSSTNCGLNGSTRRH